MENRFGIKDFFLIALLVVVIVLIVLCMVQVDRQWKTLESLQNSSRDQGHDLITIKRMLDEGINVQATTQQATTSNSGKPSVDPFKVMKDAEKMPGFARGDWLIQNCDGKLKSITPFIGQDVYAAWIQQKVQEGLIYRDVNTLEFVPMLCRSWEISQDGKTITFNLRRGITFSDGEPFTADDVVFTFKWIMNAAVNAPRERGGLELMEDVKKIDDYTVQFTFKEFFFKSLETVGGQPILPTHFYEKFTPDQFNETPGLLMGTGPYRLADPAGWKPGDRLILLRNERYWGEPPAPDRLVYFEVEEEVAQQTMFSNGELDIFAATAEQYNKMKTDPKILSIAQPLEYVYMLQGYGYISWNEEINQKPSIFADKRVRQAMTMLIDREEICRQIYLGYGSVPNGPFAAASKQADPTVKPWPYDPARAKKLLEEVGIWDRDGDGTLDTPDGKPFRFTLTYPNKYAIYERMTSFMKDGFAKVGVIMERDPVDWPILQQKMQRHEFDSVMLAWSGAIDDDPHQMFHSSQIKDQGDNVMSYRSAECDAAIDAARTCVDEARRLELWHKVHRILAEDCPYTFLVSRKSTIFVNKRWQNVATCTIGLNFNRLDYSPLTWFVPTSQQRYTK